MLGRCRLRRGVSLEVIVEEDDNAEVVFDPLMEEDDDDDDDDDSENGTGGSAPSSPREDGGRRGGRGNGGGGGTGDGEGSSLEERRRKRERRRTIGGLSRFRSVSCEALTLLDTSDMDSCCSEWDDDDELATSNSSNYVTLNRPISRRRIIESSQSQCDSEDSGIEYHSNEDDHVLEDHSSNEDHVEEEEVEEEEEEEEADREVEQDEEVEVEEVASSIEEPTEEEDEEEELEDPRLDHDDDDDEEETATITLESDNEAEDTQSNASQDVDDVLLSARTGKELFEERTKYSSEQEEAQETSTGKFNYSPNEALENDKIIIVETTTPSPKKPSQKSGLEAAEEEMRLKREAYTIRNKEVRLAELPKPDTVKSVKQLFENLNTPVQHFHAWRDLGRFREIKSNPSSKILRFDRSDGNDTIMPFLRQSLLISSSTLPRLPSQGFELTSTSKATQNATKTNKSTVKETSKKTSTTTDANRYKETPLSKILTQSQAVALKRAQGEPLGAKSAEEDSQQPVQLVKTQSGEKVALRKPIVKGFNVKKALMENPRNFLPHNHPSQQTHHQQQTQQQKSSHYSNRQRQGQSSKSQHHSETADRSDTESLASDISDDSGVSNDSILSTSSSTPSTYRVFDAYASDPSFKWIDPEVMAKIRAVGTTVIFFGPRPRPKQEGGTLPRGSKSTSSGLQATPPARTAQRVSWAGQQTNEANNRQKNQKVPGPRIVGVVRKQSPTPSSNNASPTASAQNTPTPTPLPTETHSDESRSSSPGSRSEDENGQTKTGRWRSESDTVVYNFTRPQPPAVYF